MDKINLNIEVCSECQSEYDGLTSEMQRLCPECAHYLYGYRNCNHQFENGRCVTCFWNGNHSSFIENRIKS